MSPVQQGHFVALILMVEKHSGHSFVVEDIATGNKFFKFLEHFTFLRKCIFIMIFYNSAGILTIQKRPFGVLIIVQSVISTYRRQGEARRIRAFPFPHSTQ